MEATRSVNSHTGHSTHPPQSLRYPEYDSLIEKIQKIKKPEERENFATLSFTPYLLRELFRCQQTAEKVAELTLASIGDYSDQSCGDAELQAIFKGLPKLSSLHLDGIARYTPEAICALPPAEELKTLDIAGYGAFCDLQTLSMCTPKLENLKVARCVFRPEDLILLGNWWNKLETIHFQDCSLLAAGENRHIDLITLIYLISGLPESIKTLEYSLSCVNCATSSQLLLTDFKSFDIQFSYLKNPYPFVFDDRNTSVSYFKMSKPSNSSTKETSTSFIPSALGKFEIC